MLNFEPVLPVRGLLNLVEEPVYAPLNSLANHE
jgi:hypothetical protein